MGFWKDELWCLGLIRVHYHTQAVVLIADWYIAVVFDVSSSILSFADEVALLCYSASERLPKFHFNPCHNLGSGFSHLISP